MFTVKIKIVLLLLIVQHNILTAQYIPKFTGQVDSVRYKLYAARLTRVGLDLPEDSIHRWHNIYICYLHLKAPEDTVSKYVQKAFEYDNIIECDNIWKNQEKYAGFFKSYPTAWKSFCHQCDSVQTHFDKKLMQRLFVIEANDQRYRKEMSLSEIATYPNIWKKQLLLDSINILQIDSIIQQYGYPTRQLVGIDLTKIPFLVIQHAPLNIQEKYFPIIEMAANSHSIDKSDVAYLRDRILMKKGLPQIYGTQLKWNEKKQKMELYKVAELKKVDELRKGVGLNSLVEYLKDNNVDFFFNQN